MKAAKAKDCFKIRRSRFGLGLKDERDLTKSESGTASMNEAKLLE